MLQHMVISHHLSILRVLQVMNNTYSSKWVVV